MTTLETDIADYLAHLRAQLEQIEREVTPGPYGVGYYAFETTRLYDADSKRIADFPVTDWTIKHPVAKFIANARTAYPASIAREIRLIEAMWTIVSQDNASVEAIRATYGVEYSPPPCLLEVALRDIIAEWKGANK